MERKRERERGHGTARHPIFWSHFTKSRSYFTILLVARTMRLRAVFSISLPFYFSHFLSSAPSLLPNSFSRDARLTRLRERQSLFSRTRFFSHFLSFFFSMSFFVAEKRRIETRSFVRNLTINEAFNGRYLLAAPNSSLGSHSFLPNSLSFFYAFRCSFR